MKKPPTKAALAHARKIKHRHPETGQFLTPLEKRAGKAGSTPAISSRKLKPPSLDQDAGGGYNANDDAIQE